MPESTEFRTTARDYPATTRLARHASWTNAGPLVSHMPEDEIALLEERTAATIADPGALGLWGFATGTWISATVLAGDFPAIAMLAAAPVVLVFAGIAQFIAGLYAYRRAHALMGNAFCLFGSFNVTMAVFTLLQGAGMMPMTGIPTQFQGFLLLSFGFIALALTACALRHNMVLTAVLGTLCIGYTLTGISFVDNTFGATGGSIVGTIGGYFLMASAFFAYYLGMAMMVNSAWKRTMLPILGEP